MLIKGDELNVNDKAHGEMAEFINEMKWGITMVNRGLSLKIDLTRSNGSTSNKSSKLHLDQTWFQRINRSMRSDNIGL